MNRVGAKRCSRKTIPKWVAETPEYEAALQEMMWNIFLENATPFDALRAYKDMMWAASAIAIRKYFISKRPSTASQMQQVLQASRAIVEQNTKLAQLVTKRQQRP